MGLDKAIVERLSGCATVYGTTRTDRPLTGRHRLTVDITNASTVRRAINQVVSHVGIGLYLRGIDTWFIGWRAGEAAVSDSGNTANP